MSNHWLQISCVVVLFFFFFKDFIYSFLERGEGKDKERERNINVWLPLTCPPLGTWPATQACALSGNQTGDPLVRSPCSVHWATPARAYHCLLVFRVQVFNHCGVSIWPFPLPWLRDSQKECVLFCKWIVTSFLPPFGSGVLSCDCFFLCTEVVLFRVTHKTHASFVWDSIKQVSDTDRGVLCCFAGLPPSVLLVMWVIKAMSVPFSHPYGFFSLSE